MTVTTTYEKLFDYALTAQRWLSPIGSDGKKNETLAAARKNTKLGYAISKMEARVKKAAEGYNARIEDHNIDFCSTDKDGVILTDANGGFRYEKAELKKRNAANRALQLESVDVEVYFATALPDDLTEQEIESLAGIVIAPATE